ncbi:MAG: radical SAM protein [Acidobacteriota bacterium]
MRKEAYADFSLRIHEAVATQRFPLSGTIEVSHRCPLACLHCYNNLSMGDTNARQQELTYQEYCRLLDEISEAGCLWLLFTGGEIFARKDFLDIYGYAKQKGFLITLFTNATLITPKIADYLAEWPPFSIEVTIYGATQETYERLTAVPGSYQRCLQGINLLSERALPVKLKTVMVTINKHELGQMQQLADNLGLEFKFDGMLNPRIDCSQSPLAVRLQPEELVELDLRDPARVAEWRRFAEQFSGPVHSSEHSDELYHCGGGVNSFAIDPYGNMSICVLSQIDKYDLRQGSFRTGWEQFLQQVRYGKKITLQTKCIDCEMKAMCGMCPANGELENRHPEKPVDFLCQVAHLRAYTLGLPIKPHGDCEYCLGGNRYEEFAQIAVTLKHRVETDPLPMTSRSLPVLGQPASVGGCSTGGCLSCSK